MTDVREISAHELRDEDTIINNDRSAHLRIIHALGDDNVSELFEFLTPFGVIGLWADTRVRILDRTNP